MTTSTPPAWHWRDECYVPVPTPELPESATLRERNDSNPDPTYQDCWPSERYPSDGPERAVSTTGSSTFCADQCPECRCAPGQPHATGCDEAAKVTDSVINVESCPECGAVTDLDYGESVPCGQRVGEDGICGYWGGQFPGRETGPEEETHEDLQGKGADKMADTFSVPFEVQEWMFESTAERSIAWLHGLIDDHHTRIIEMARDRFRKGYAKYGSAMYSWSPERRLDETLQELADAVVYPTSGLVALSPANASQDEDTALCGKGLESCFESADHDGVAGTVAT